MVESDLKTLKDMQRFTPDICDDEIVCRGDEDGSYIAHYELRQEAIKWVKIDKRVLRIVVGYERIGGGTASNFTSIKTPITKDIYLDSNLRAGITHFFNITEEDLE